MVISLMVISFQKSIFSSKRACFFVSSDIAKYFINMKEHWGRNIEGSVMSRFLFIMSVFSWGKYDSIFMVVASFGACYLLMIQGCSKSTVVYHVNTVAGCMLRSFGM